MPHIRLPEGVPGILGPMSTSPETTKPLLELAEVLLRGPNTLSSAEREMIATYVSAQNDCTFCQLSHGASAAEHLGGDYKLDVYKRQSAQTTFFTPGAGIFAPQSFFGTGPFSAFGPGTPVDFLFLEPSAYFGKQIPQRTLPFDTGLYSGPAAPAFTNATDLNFRHTLSSLYAQDQWKIRPDLTVTLGVRYDIDFMPSAAEVRVTGMMSPTNYNNVQPRIGLAYSFRQDKGVVRAGFGMFTGPFDYSDIMVSWQGASEMCIRDR